MGSTDFTKLLFLLSIAQRLEWRGQTQFCWSSTIWLGEARLKRTADRIPAKWKFSTHKRKQNRVNILLIVHHLTCCQPLRSHYCKNQTCKLWKETWPTWEFLGPIVHGPMLAFLPMSRVLPLFHCSLSFHKWGALLNWSGWVWGPWDLRISPNFYSCFQ